jgi:hypothetical protein
MSARIRLSAEALRELAEANKVCIRPVVHEVYDSVTGETQLIPTPCGATRDSKCAPCAQKNRVLRMQQCREGWHLDKEPTHDDPRDDSGDPEDADKDDSDENERKATRRTRSTRRRQDTPDLPRLPVEARTIGKAFTTPNGRTYRPSMFATFTLPSYGRVRPDGTPVDPDRYNYRRAALDALHFPKLIDRFWQNLRRAVGYQVQYFAAVEPQRRLAPHLHAAVRGAISRQVFRQVVAATYHQVWWPPHEKALYVDILPVWDQTVGYADPSTGVPLPTWQESLDRLDDDDEARPAHVIRFGRQMDLQGILATEGDADRRIGYLTKYLAKSFTDAYASEEEASPRQVAHLARLHEEVRWLPCSPRCWNWLRFGVQPQAAADGMVPGKCPSKAHDREHLGCGGRRVLVSRKWTGKTLSDHRADRAEVVRQVLAAAGVDAPEIERLSASVAREDGTPRFHWKIWDPLDASVPVYRQVMTRAIAEKLRWKRQYDRAKEHAGPDPPAASTPPRPPDSRPTKVAGLAVKGERSESRSDTTVPLTGRQATGQSSGREDETRPT